MKKIAFTLCLATVAAAGLSACETYTSQNQPRTAGGIEVVGSPASAEPVFRSQQMK